MSRRVAIAAALVAIVAYSFYLRWRLLTFTPFPIGIDGYFYPVQLRSLLAHGHLAYPASPLAFWFMAPFAAIAGPITGAKLGAALGGALVALPAFAVGERLAKGAGLAAAAIAAFSAGSTFLTVEYVKNGIGITVALAALWLILRALETPTRRRWIAAALGIAAALLAHKMAAALVIFVGVPAGLQARRGVLRGRRLIYVVLAVLAGFVALLLVGLIAPRMLISADDAQLLGGLFSSDATWDALADRISLRGEPLAALIVGVAAGAALIYKRDRRVVAWAIVLLGVAIGIPWLDVSDPQGLAFRLRLVAFVPIALGAAIVLAAVPHRAWVAAALALVAAIAAPRDETVEGEILAHPALVASALALQHQIPDGKIAIVPERHIAFMVAWYADVPVALRPEHVPHDQRVRVMPLSFIGDGSPLDAALLRARALPEPPLGVHPRVANGMVLVTEATWDWLLAQLAPDVRRHFARWPTI